MQECEDVCRNLADFWIRNVAKVCKSYGSRQALSLECFVFFCKDRLRYSREKASQSWPKISKALEKSYSFSRFFDFIEASREKNADGREKK